MTYRKRLILFFLLILSACASQTPSLKGTHENLPSEGSSDARLSFVEAKKKQLSATASPVKGRFLDYIYRIQPDHKQEGYSISTSQLSDGYAYGTGPYDGWFVEFFLIRGADHDLVLKQVSGYEDDHRPRTYGFVIESYIFEKGNMKKVPLLTVIPIGEIDSLFQKQIEKIKSDRSLDTNGWAFYRLLRLPIKGTTAVLKVCSENPEPPFSTMVKCAVVGTLLWNKKKFIPKAASTFELSDELI